VRGPLPRAADDTHAWLRPGHDPRPPGAAETYTRPPDIGPGLPRLEPRQPLPAGPAQAAGGGLHEGIGTSSSRTPAPPRRGARSGPQPRAPGVSGGVIVMRQALIDAVRGFLAGGEAPHLVTDQPEPLRARRHVNSASARRRLARLPQLARARAAQPAAVMRGGGSRSGRGARGSPGAAARRAGRAARGAARPGCAAARRLQGPQPRRPRRPGCSAAGAAAARRCRPGSASGGRGAGGRPLQVVRVGGVANAAGRPSTGRRARLPARGGLRAGCRPSTAPR
jgi:hypothetical protein